MEMCSPEQQHPLAPDDWSFWLSLSEASLASSAMRANQKAHRTYGKNNEVKPDSANILEGA